MHPKMHRPFYYGMADLETYYLPLRNGLENVSSSNNFDLKSFGNIFLSLEYMNNYSIVNKITNAKMYLENNTRTKLEI